MLIRQRKLLVFAKTFTQRIDSVITYPPNANEDERNYLSGRFFK